MQNQRNILVFAEQEESIVHNVTLELLGKGRDIADKLQIDLDVVFLGEDIEKQAKDLIYYGADNVFLFDGPSLREFDVVLYKRNIVKLAEELRPEIFLIGATRIGRSLAPRIAAYLRTGLTADCVDLEIDREGNLVQIRPAFSGNIMARIKTKTKPQMATVRYKVMEIKEKNINRSGKIIRRNIEDIRDTGIKTIEKVKSDEVNISEAEVIVSGGNGLREPEDFQLLERLAEALGGTVGSSRPLVDSGWISRDHQVGFSGNTVKPRVYIACGISGAPQHLFGMRDSDLIISINKDDSAPICSFSDYCVIGDLYEIIPSLITKISEYEKGENS